MAWHMFLPMKHPSRCVVTDFAKNYLVIHINIDTFVYCYRFVSDW